MVLIQVVPYHNSTFVEALQPLLGRDLGPRKCRIWVRTKIFKFRLLGNGYISEPHWPAGDRIPCVIVLRWLECTGCQILNIGYGNLNQGSQLLLPNLKGHGLLKDVLSQIFLCNCSAGHDRDNIFNLCQGMLATAAWAWTAAAHANYQQLVGRTFWPLTFVHWCRIRCRTSDLDPVCNNFMILKRGWSHLLSY